MTFEEALKALKEGKKIRNNHWRQGFYVMLKDNKIVNNYGDIYFVYVRSFREDCWEEYKGPILDEEEKKYLSAVIRPFRDRVKYIYKINVIDDCSQIISIRMERYDFEENPICEYMYLPYFKKDTLYKNMEAGKKYTLKELGL